MPKLVCNSKLLQLDRREQDLKKQETQFHDLKNMNQSQSNWLMS